MTDEMIDYMEVIITEAVKEINGRKQKNMFKIAQSNVVIRGGSVLMNQRRDLKDIVSRERVIFYGIGNQFRECLKLFEGKTEIVLFDRNKKGTYQGKYKIHALEQLESYYVSGTAVIISSVRNQYEIAYDLVNDYHIAEDDLFSYTSKDYEERVYQPDLISTHEEKIREAYCLLEDEASKEYWKNALLMRITRQPLLIKPNSHAVVIGEYKEVVKLEKGDVIIDCGAYIGDTAKIYMERLAGDCSLHAIEPFGENFSKLQENIRANNWNNVNAYHCAVGDTEGKTVLHYEAEDFKMGITVGKVIGTHTEEVEIHTLDQLFADLPKIDYLKMDIEGEEVRALQGASDILKNKEPKLMISGYHRLSDFWEIPCLIKEKNPAYKIFVGHAPGVSMEVEYYCKI